jgi:hypothetical protein
MVPNKSPRPRGADPACIGNIPSRCSKVLRIRRSALATCGKVASVHPTIRAFLVLGALFAIVGMITGFAYSWVAARAAFAMAVGFPTGAALYVYLRRRRARRVSASTSPES